ncbi:MAG: phosphoribosylamine--glycine ligase [Nitrococcus sp.]|nr:phosphoribosylamine--glycine ligase [Nitrococcus sp.]
MKVLVIGSGAREHALAWAAARSANVELVYVAPGNAGTRQEPKLQNVAVGAEDVPALVDFARQYEVDLTIAGPEAPLLMGVVDAFNAGGLRCFGPSRGAAELEGSKTFCKDFLLRHGIPTAEYRVFTDPDAARDYIRERGAPIVVKVDGLAAGKGVTVAMSLDEALQAVQSALVDKVFGAAGERVVVEEYLRGEEVSFMVLADGESALALATSQDHKARDEGEKGPNTGGMGAYSPAALVSASRHERIMDEIIEPTIAGMAKDGRRYVGFLYAGLMITPDGSAKVLEFNVRLGDPEAQPVLMRLKSDLIQLCDAALGGRLDRCSADWDERACLAVVMASGGYPGNYSKGHRITGLPTVEQANCKVFHAGSAFDEQGNLINVGGRVLSVCALGETVSLAQARAYELVRAIHWDDVCYRGDIGYRAVERERRRGLDREMYQHGAQR